MVGKRRPTNHISGSIIAGTDIHKKENAMKTATRISALVLVVSGLGFVGCATTPDPQLLAADQARIFAVENEIRQVKQGQDAHGQSIQDLQRVVTLQGNDIRETNKVTHEGLRIAAEAKIEAQGARKDSAVAMAHSEETRRIAIRLQGQVTSAQVVQPKVGALLQEWRLAGNALGIHTPGFASGSSKLSPEITRKLDGIVATINAAKADERPTAIAIYGYASEGGKPEDNNKLANERALAGREYVVARLKATVPVPAAPKLAPGAPATPPATGTPVVDPKNINAFVGGTTTDFGSSESNQALYIRLFK